MPFRMLRTAGAALVLTWGLAAASHAADDWMNLATVSATMGMNAGRICVGASMTDVGCPTYAPEVGADGSISASRFVGDGSGLTGVVASTADRIVSGTTSLLAVSGTGFVSLTQAGTNTGWFDPARGLVTLGVSSTGRISTTDLAVRGTIDIVTGTASVVVGRYAGNAAGTLYTTTTAVGYAAAQYNTGANIVALGASAGQFNAGANVVAAGFGAGQYNSSSAVTVMGNYAGQLSSGTTLTATGYMAAQNNTGANVAAFGGYAGQNNTNNYATMLGNYAGRSNTGAESTMSGFSSGEVNTGHYLTATGFRSGQYNAGSNVTAIGYNAAQYNSGSQVTTVGLGSARFNTASNITAVGYNAATSNTYSNVTALGYNAQPSRANQVVLGDGNVVEVTTTGIILAGGLNTSGTVTATRFVGDGSGLTGVVASTADRIVSGTTSMVAVSGTGFVSLTQAGTNTGWFDPTRGLVTLGVSATGRVSASSGYFGGQVEIGSGAGSARLIIRDSAQSYGGYLRFGDVGTGLYFPSSTIATASLALMTSYTEAMRIVSSGYVGIGTASPTARFEVSGTVSATRFMGDGSGLTGVASASPSIASGLSGSIVFRDETGYLKAYNTFSISSTTGSVGIGSGSPAWLGANAFYAAGNVYGYSFYVPAGGGLKFGSGSARIDGSGNIGNDQIVFSASSTEAMRIVSTSFIGIGTASPTARFEVSGTVSATYVKLADNDNLPCTPERYGTLRYSNGKQYMCMPR
ncbi:beta strand repeat-containing protein [Ancylobacter polymorphus]|uniref:Trimeric autotransporter adhesin YadA-like head domain-containing protein n=1 Tax=Ancylobacter polymorphus TaxID=223390 RepID=A0A9E7CZ10_9HYPH|nr:hypothetical protein [Ancylobacter polymorphus]UOK73989.1 hypothetical protein K9D25_24790 [Ancylobacter polymorphus]